MGQRGRGRGGRNVRVRTVVDQNFQPDARYDSGDEDHIDVPRNALENDFQEAPLDEEIDECLELLENVNLEDIPNEAVSNAAVHHTVIDNMGNEEHALNYEFASGKLPTHLSLMEKIGNLSPSELLVPRLVHFGFLPFFEELRTCSNAHAGINVTFSDMLCYHAILTLMTYVHLPTMSGHDCVVCEDNDMRGRKKRRKCRHCPNKNPDGTVNNNRKTMYICNTCDIALHPQCFVAYHVENGSIPTPVLTPSVARRLTPTSA